MAAGIQEFKKAPLCAAEFEEWGGDLSVPWRGRRTLVMKGFMATTPKALTYQEWLKLPEAEGIEEVVNGEIRRMPPNKILHADTVENLAELLRAVTDRRTVQVRVSTFGLVIRRDPLTTRVPDIALFVRSNVVEMDGYVHSAPELVVEVLSPANTRAERTEKLKDYESLGVPEVWVVSPEAQTVEVLLLQNGRLTTSALLREGRMTPVCFPDVALDIASIWPKH